MRSLIVFAALLPLPSPPRPPAMECEVEATALDYAFQLPEELPAGRTTFRFANRGKVAHELNIVLLRPGVCVQSVRITLK